MSAWDSLRPSHAFRLVLRGLHMMRMHEFSSAIMIAQHYVLLIVWPFLVGFFFEENRNVV